MINRRVLTIAVVAGVLLVLASVDTASAESHEPQQWPAPQSANGYVVFEYTTLANLPGAHVPKPGDVLKKVSCALAADEYESVQFGVHALSGDIKDIQVKVTTDLQVTVYHRISPDVSTTAQSCPVSHLLTVGYEQSSSVCWIHGKSFH